MNNSPIGGVIPARHYIALLFLATLWSSSFMVIKVSVVTIPPFTLTAIRLFVAMIFLWGILAMKGEPLPKTARGWYMCFLVGLFGNALPFTLIGWGEEVVDSGLTAVLLAAMPFSTVVLAHFFTDGDRLTRQRTLGIVIGFMGIVILVGPSVMEGLGNDALRQLAIAAAGLSYAVTTVLARNMPPSSLLGRSVAIMITAFVQLLPFALWIEQPWTLEPSNTALLGAFHLGIMPTGAATLIYLYLIAARGAGFFAYINYLVPILGVIWGAALMGEQITQQVLAALGAILMGLFIANYRFKKRNQDRP